MGTSNQIQWWQGRYNTKLTPPFCKSAQSELSKDYIWFPNIQDFLFVTSLCSLHAHGEEEATAGTRQVPCPRFFRKAMMLQSPGHCPSLLGMPPAGGTQSW